MRNPSGCLETARVVTLAEAEAAVRGALQALIDEYRTQLTTARADNITLARENDAMRQLFTAWMMADALPPEQRAELERRTAALGGVRKEVGDAQPR